MVIKLYFADVGPLEDPDLFAALYQAVSPSRRKKVDRVRTVGGKLLSLGAGALLEASLAELGVTAPRLDLGENGKPYLADQPGLFFNLSHSGTRVLCALSDGEIGCDVERVKAPRLKVARRCFHPLEVRALDQCKDPAAQAALFYKLWTLKESFLKVTGLGFQLPLNAFSIELEGETITVNQSVDDRQYAFLAFSGDGYQYAVCGADHSLSGIALTERFFPELIRILPGNCSAGS